MLICAAIQMAIALGSGLVQAIPQILASIPQVVGAILNGFATGLAPMLEKGKEAISGMWAGISESASMLWSNIQNFVTTNIIEPFKAKLVEVKNIGINIVKGIWDGILSSVAWLKG